MSLMSLRSKWNELPDSVKDNVEKRSFSQVDFLCCLIRENGFTNILEIGTYKGKTACFMAASAAENGGRVTSINIDMEETLEAERLAGSLGLGPDNISLVVGDSIHALRELSGDWDLVFIDGCHSYKNVMAEFNMVRDRLKENAIVVFDDVAEEHCDSFGDGGVRRAVQEAGATLVQVGDCQVAVYKKGDVRMGEDSEDDGLKIVFAGVFNKNSTNYSQANALERTGAQVLRFEISVKNYELPLMNLCEDESPDLLLLSKCVVLDNSTLHYIRLLGVKCYLWFMDPFFTFDSPKMRERVGLCDWSFFNIRETYDKALEISHKCSFLHEGFDSEVDYPRDVNKEYDVVFIGNMRKGRKKFKKAYPFIIETNTYGEDHARMVSATKINLNFTDGGASDRVYKVMAAGGFLLTEPWPNMEADFEVGVDLDIFVSVKELEEKVAYYLSHDEERERIAANGLRKVQKFSRDEWAKRIVSRVLGVPEQPEAEGRVAISESVRSRTIVDKGKLDGMLSLFKNFDRGSELNIIEVGVYKGGVGLLLSDVFYSSNIFLCDTFEGIPYHDEQRDNHHRRGDFKDVSVEEVRALFSSSKVQVVKGVFPQCSTKEMNDTVFDIVHLDVDVYQGYKDCLEYFSTRMAEGGIIILDDYKVSSCQGATIAVDEFLRDNDGFEMGLEGVQYFLRLTSNNQRTGIDFMDAPEFGRQQGLKKALVMLDNFRSDDVVIVETGTTRGSLGGGTKGDGWATLAFGWYCSKYGGQVFTIDCMEEAMGECRRITKDYSDWITYEVSDSVKYLNSFGRKIDLLYLDSCNDPVHIENELRAVYDLLKQTSIVVVDDTDAGSGKGEMVSKYLKNKGWMIEFNSSRQLIAVRSSSFGFGGDMAAYEESHCERFNHLVNDLDLNSIKDSKVIDIGCGDGFIFKRMSETSGNVLVGVDGMNLQTGDFEFRRVNLDYPYSYDLVKEFGMFDFAFMFEVIEHVGNPYSALAELKRVLKKDGILYLTIPTVNVQHNVLYPGLFYPVDNFREFLGQMAFEVYDERIHKAAFEQHVFLARNKDWTHTRMRWPKRQWQDKPPDYRINV